MIKASSWFSIVLFLFLFRLSGADSNLPCAPVSEIIDDYEGVANLQFCSEWNPEFGIRGSRCCPKVDRSTRKRQKSWCAPNRIKVAYCDDMTEDQRAYSAAAAQGKLGNVLELIRADIARKRNQAYCSVNNGFLAFGRRLIPSVENRVRLRHPQRCVDFGTDEMIGLLEWVGRKINEQYSAPEYKGVHFLIGDISAPKGGCLSGRTRGRRGHASHTSGQDVDIGFLHAKPNRISPSNFDKVFDPAPNWWLVKEMFKNPFVCVKAIFLDRKHIASLSKVAAGDPDWALMRDYIRHVKSHKNHFHVRVGNRPGAPGCIGQDISDEEPVDEDEDTETPAEAN